MTAENPAEFVKLQAGGTATLSPILESLPPDDRRTASGANRSFEDLLASFPKSPRGLETRSHYGLSDEIIAATKGTGRRRTPADLNRNCRAT